MLFIVTCTVFTPSELVVKFALLLPVTLLATYFPFCSSFTTVNSIGVLFNAYPSGASISVIVIVSGFETFVICILLIFISPLESVVYSCALPLFMLILNLAPNNLSWFEESCFINFNLYEPESVELLTVIFTVFTPLLPWVTLTLPFSTSPSLTFEVTLLATYLPSCNAFVTVNVIGVSFKIYPSGAVISVIVIVSGFDMSVIFIPSIVISPLESVVYGAAAPLFMLILNVAPSNLFLLEESCFTNLKLYEPVGFGSVTSDVLE